MNSSISLGVENAECAGGKPIGIKLCIGYKHEFFSLCKAMLETGITPDFITVDGGEGGTGAAPIELTNAVGTPLRDGLNFVHNALRGIGMRDRIKIIASGKAFSAFHMFRTLALGADAINSARAMMFSLGCIQSRHCNNDTCPTGITTQSPGRYKALDIEDKTQRVYNYHHAMVENLLELAGTAGLKSLSEINPRHVHQRTSGATIKHFGELYPMIPQGALLKKENVPENYKTDWQLAKANTWQTTEAVPA